MSVFDHCACVNSIMMKITFAKYVFYKTVISSYLKKKLQNLWFVFDVQQRWTDIKVKRNKK